MSFPETRHTLIERLASHSAESDWQQFMTDYWRPVCRFAARWGKINADDAEDVASLTFQAIISSSLLSRWTRNRSAKLSTMLCAVVRNVLSNRARVQSGRERLLEENRELLLELATVQSGDDKAVSGEQSDAFYSAWANELLQDTVESLLDEYFRENRGDYFRVLYGRICERMTEPEIAESLDLTTTTVQNYYRHARQRLGDTLKRLLEQRLHRYCADERFSAEFQSEWTALSEYLTGRGGIEKALRESYEEFDSSGLRRREQKSVTTILSRVGQFLDSSEP